MTSLSRHLMVTTAALALTACSLVPDYARPTVSQPQNWGESAIVLADYAPAAEADWWANYGSAELDALIDEAMRTSPTMDAALARIAQSRAGLSGANATLLPALNGSANVSRRHSLTEGGAQDNSWSESAGLSASYEADLFGANRARVEGAVNALDQQRFNTEATALMLQADIATRYFTAVSLAERLRVARANLEAAERILELVRVRYDAGALSGFDLARQESSVAGTRAGVVSLEQQNAENARALAILVGRAPEGGYVSGYVAIDDLSDLALPLPAPGQPSDLLARRPDLKAAEAGLKGANADIGAARTAFFPSLNLSAGATAAGLLTNPASLVSSLAAGLAQPIFRGGALDADLDASKARYRELAANYRDAVLNAFGETMDALTAVETSERRAEQLRIAAENAGRAFDLARRQYDAGAIDLLELLDAQRSQLNASDALVQAEQARLQASVDLFRALGGSWRLPEDAVASL